jgi:hypothetical protein
MPEDDLAVDWSHVIAERKINDASEEDAFDGLSGPIPFRIKERLAVREETVRANEE